MEYTIGNSETTMTPPEIYYPEMGAGQPAHAQLANNGYDCSNHRNSSNGLNELSNPCCTVNSNTGAAFRSRLQQQRFVRQMSSRNGLNSEDCLRTANMQPESSKGPDCQCLYPQNSFW